MNNEYTILRSRNYDPFRLNIVELIVNCSIEFDLLSYVVVLK